MKDDALLSATGLPVLAPARHIVPELLLQAQTVQVVFFDVDEIGRASGRESV